MNITLFKDMTPGMIVYALVKDDDLKYMEGSIVSVGQPRMNMPEMKAGQMPMPTMPTMQNVVDVTYSMDGKNHTDTVETTASMFPTNKPGALTLVSTDKEAIVRELHATLNTGENYLRETEREIPKQKKRIEQSKELIAQLDTEFKQKQQTEERFAKLESTQKEQGGKLDRIIELLQKNNPTT